MNTKEILNRVNEIFIDVLDNEEIVLNENTNANDIDEWDSLTHIQLIVAIEKAFKTKFTSMEIQSWKNVGQMCDAIEKKIKAS
jgi:acyl carrier protein